jgi:Tfp pilus assembly protein PilP
VTQTSEEKQASAAQSKAKANVAVPPVPQIAAPEVKVQGILLSGKGNRAIVVGPNSTFIVKQGDKLGDYKVASIADRRVVFSFKDKKFPVVMESEFPDLSKK